MSDSASPPVVPCPICGKPRVQQFRPFCSKRCADVDLNRWLSDVYAVPASAADSGEDEKPSTKLADEEPLLRELASFLEAVEQKRDAVVPGEHGVRAMKAAETILTEMRAHRWK